MCETSFWRLESRPLPLTLHKHFQYMLNVINMLRIITTQMSVLNNIAKISVDTEIIEAHDKKSYNTTSSHTKEQVENAKTQNLHLTSAKPRGRKEEIFF